MKHLIALTIWNTECFTSLSDHDCALLPQNKQTNKQILCLFKRAVVDMIMWGIISFSTWVLFVDQFEIVTILKYIKDTFSKMSLSDLVVGWIAFVKSTRMPAASTEKLLQAFISLHELKRSSLNHCKHKVIHKQIMCMCDLVVSWITFEKSTWVPAASTDELLQVFRSLH